MMGSLPVPTASIDAHAHLGSGFQPWRGRDLAEDLVRTSAERGITGTLVSTLGAEGLLEHPRPEELRAANEITRRAVERWPENLFGLVYLSPEHIRASIEELQRHVVDGPFVGVKLWIALRSSDRRLDLLIERIAELGVPVLQHAWYKSVGGTPGESTPLDVAVLARRYPEVLLQMAHLGGAGARGLRDIAPHANVVVDTSGSDPVLGEVEYAVQQLGADRILFGSDAPIRDPATALSKVTGAAITDEERDLILGGNARRLYRGLRRT